MTGVARTPTLDTFGAFRDLPGCPDTRFASLAAAQAGGAGTLDSLPYSLRVLAENLLRHEDGRTVTADHLRALTAGRRVVSIPFTPGRILLQDASGIPVIADIVTLQERVLAMGLEPNTLSPRLQMDLVVDHAVEVDESGSATALTANLDLEYMRHTDRYRFLRWAQNRIPELRVVPPGVGICHQLNLEVFAEVVTLYEDSGTRVAGFDTLVGTDSHTTMINALSVLGWGVGGIEATAAALGQPILLPVPEVIGIRLSGRIRPGVLATDIALTLAGVLRLHGVVQKIVEFYGPGLADLSVPDRATVANMAPEYGATMAFFPADHRTLAYLDESGRSSGLARSYLVAQGMLYSDRSPDPTYAEVLDFDLSQVERTMAGPSRPHQAVTPDTLPAAGIGDVPRGDLDDGAIVIASITSCTNTSNPRAMMAAGLLARNARRRGIHTPWWVKTSLTPGSRSAADLLRDSGVQDSLDELGFHVAGFGCGTCMGNSGPLPDEVARHIRENDTQAVAVLSGNRNFPGRIHPDVTHTYLASPPMVVAAALSGRLSADLGSGALCEDTDGKPVTLEDLWPSDAEIDALIEEFGTRSLQRASTTAPADERWVGMDHPTGETYPWDGETGSIRRPPFTEPELTVPMATGDIRGARALLVLGDGVTTDHISPVARITRDSASGRWLSERGVHPHDFGSYSSRRLNHEVMLRGGFANPRLENRLVPELTGGWTRVAGGAPDPVPVHVAAAEYGEGGIPAVVVAGHSYGAGSARDWAAKVTRMLGIRAVIARSFERIHRTNLVAMGVLPIECSVLDPADVELDDEIDIVGLIGGIETHKKVSIVIKRDGHTRTYSGQVRIDTAIEVSWIERGGVIPHLLNDAAQQVLE